LKVACENETSSINLETQCKPSEWTLGKQCGWNVKGSRRSNAGAVRRELYLKLVRGLDCLVLYQSRCPPGRSLLTLPHQRGMGHRALLWTPLGRDSLMGCGKVSFDPMLAPTRSERQTHKPRRKPSGEKAAVLGYLHQRACDYSAISLLSSLRAWRVQTLLQSVSNLLARPQLLRGK